MNKLARTAKGIGGFLMGSYLFVVFLMTPYYNWQYAKDHGFVAWFLFGAFIPTAKAVAWPYFVFLADRHPSETVAATKLIEYTDNKYDYAFQFPSDWKIQKPPDPSGEAGEIRVMVQSPRKGTYVTTTVGHLGNKPLSKEQFEASPNRDTAVNALIEFTIEQIYKKTSRQIGASSMIVSEKHALQSDAGVSFYISTAHFVDIPTAESTKKFAVGMAGIHVAPFGKDYVITFLMVSPIDPKATSENETMTRVFNSFHVAGERPR